MIARDCRSMLRLAFESLDFEAPYLMEKLLLDRIVDSTAEAEALFNEVKRYLVLAEVDHSRIVEMCSLRIDEVWHQFVLFTDEYTRFCRRYYGRYVSHAPSNAPKARHQVPKKILSFVEFEREYERLFEIPLPCLWLDHRSVTTQRRIVNHNAGRLTVLRLEDMLVLTEENGESQFSVNECAADAMAFIANTGAFYVRELPGDISNDERVDLISALVELRFLRVAS